MPPAALVLQMLQMLPKGHSAHISICRDGGGQLHPVPLLHTTPELYITNIPLAVMAGDMMVWRTAAAGGGVVV